MGAADAGGRRLVPGGRGLRRPGARPCWRASRRPPIPPIPSTPGQSTGTASWRCASGVTPRWSSWSTTSTSSPPWVSDACSSGCCWRRTSDCTSWSAAGRRPRSTWPGPRSPVRSWVRRTWGSGPAETVELFRDCYDLPLSDPDARILTRRTGGWAAALHLFHHTVAGRAPEVRHRSVRALGRRDDYAREYLAQTFLGGLDADELSLPAEHRDARDADRRPLRQPSRDQQQPGPAHRSQSSRRRRTRRDRGRVPHAGGVAHASARRDAGGPR